MRCHLVSARGFMKMKMNGFGSVCTLSLSCSNRLMIKRAAGMWNVNRMVAQVKWKRWNNCAKREKDERKKNSLTQSHRGTPTDCKTLPITKTLFSIKMLKNHQLKPFQAFWLLHLYYYAVALVAFCFPSFEQSIQRALFWLSFLIIRFAFAHFRPFRVLITSDQFTMIRPIFDCADYSLVYTCFFSASVSNRLRKFTCTNDRTQRKWNWIIWAVEVKHKRSKWNTLTW